MGRLIDADDCKDLMYVMCAGQDKAFVRAMEQVIDDCPDVDAMPVKHGRWIDRGDYVTTAYGSLCVNECSICHKEITIDDADDFCPNRGAKNDARPTGEEA